MLMKLLDTYYTLWAGLLTSLLYLGKDLVKQEYRYQSDIMSELYILKEAFAKKIMIWEEGIKFSVFIADWLCINSDGL